MQHVLQHFYRLPEKARTLLVSFVCYSAVIPILSIFLSTYILRFSNNFNLLILYYSIFFISVPAGFFINGFLLRYIKVNVLYGIGLILFVLSNSSIVFFHNLSAAGIGLFGTLYGLGSGIYWGNRNLLTLEETESDTRVYFNSVELITSTILTVVIPGLAGWFISFSEISHLYSIRMAYIALMMSSVLLVLLSSFYVFRIKFKKVHLPSLLVQNVSAAWWAARLMTFAEGITNGISFILPTYLLFKYVGKENAVGSFDSIVALVVAAILYFIGIMLTKNNRLKMTIASYFGIACATVFIFFNRTSTGVIVYLGLLYLFTSIAYISGHAILLDITDHVKGKNENGSYCYVFDRELFLNLGRLLGLISMVLLVPRFSLIQYEQVPLVASVLQLSVLSVSLYILKKNKIVC